MASLVLKVDKKERDEMYEETWRRKEEYKGKSERLNEKIKELEEDRKKEKEKLSNQINNLFDERMDLIGGFEEMKEKAKTMEIELERAKVTHREDIDNCTF